VLRRLRAHEIRPKRRLLAAILALAALVAAALIAAAFAFDRNQKPAPTGDLLNRYVPALPLRDARGRSTSLAAFRGKLVVLTPFLTLCHEVCPLTTGAFMAMQRSVEEAGLGERVRFVEVSVDPWRDTPTRLRLFARMTGARFELLTGTKAQLTRFWRFFGVAFWRTREGKPPDTDWLTHKPLHFDVSHTAGLFLLDQRGDERIAVVGMPGVGPRLSGVLRALLNAQGRKDLADPHPGWTTQQGLDDIGYLLGRRIAASAP
jgi:cytochrome oxidase Cu insertion factor (SCO1/SenC/PrrC family)